MSTYYKSNAKEIDYIFYTPNQMKVLKLLDAPDAADLELYKNTPSTKFPSDHFRMEAEFEVFYFPETTYRKPEDFSSMVSQARVQ